MLAEMVQTVQERDPDVIEGHNFFRFDLEYLEARARRYGVKLKLGRDKSNLSGQARLLTKSQPQIAFDKLEGLGVTQSKPWDAMLLLTKTVR